MVALHHLRQIRHRAGALDEVQLRAVAAADVVHAAVAGDGGNHLDAQAFVVIAMIHASPARLNSPRMLMLCGLMLVVSPVPTSL